MTICSSCIEPCGGDANFCPNCGYSEGAPAEYGVNLPVKSILKGRYHVGRAIGTGSFGITYVAWDDVAKRKVVIKEYLPSEFATRVSGDEAVVVFKDEKKQKQYHDGLVKFVEEGEKLCKMPENNGIVRAYECFVFNKTAYVVMEYLKGITLAEWLEKEQAVLNEEGAVNMLMPVISSLQVAHSEGLIHGDISPKNIFLTSDGQVKLVDFGAARFATTSHSRSLTALVAQGYSPEEQYRSTGDHGPHTDVYALGAVFYRLMKGAPPPDALERRMSLELHKKDIIKPLKDFPKANAIMNALNVRIQDRTANMADLSTELLSEKPVKRRGNRIRAIDFGRLSLKAKAVIVLTALLVCTAGALFATGVIKFGTETEIVPEGMTIVPSVVNQDYERAIEMLTENGLQPSLIGTEFSTNIPKDYVLLQDLTAGSIVNINTMVLLTISGGPQLVRVPPLAGQEATDVMLALEALGFVVRQEARFSQALKAGLVIGTSEEPGAEIPLGSTIFLYVSQGPSIVLGSFVIEVPDLIGLSWEEVIIKAEDTGFLIELIGREYSDTVAENHVISQSLEPRKEQMNGPDNPIGLVMSLGPRVSRVPDVRLKTEQDAIAMFKAEGLRYTISYENSSIVAKELVISQDPESGTVLPYGGSVSIVVSVGEPPFPIPNVVGATESEARSTLTAAGLTVTVSFEPSQRAPGIVLRQSVAAGAMVRRGDSVTITVSSEDPIVEVPGVVDAERAVAERRIKDAKLNPSVNEVYSETVPQGRVISQNPAAGTFQMRDSVVYLSVSLGPEPRVVPNLVNLQQSTAEAILRDRGLVVDADSEYSPTVGKGLVMSQNPADGARVPRGSVVNIIVSLGPEGKVPDTVGLTRANAEKLLGELGYVVAITEEFHPTILEGRVMRQNPIAGVTLKAGEIVTLTISNGVQMVKVPYVIDEKLDDARLILEVSLLGVSSTQVESTKPKGMVLTQSPAANQEVPQGSVVSLTVSKGTTFNVAANASPPGSGTPSASPASAEQGATIALRANPASGFEFVSWEGIPGTGTSNLQNTSFTMPASEVSVTAVFRQIERNIVYIIIPVGGGSVTGPSSAVPGSQVRLDAYPNSGFEFGGWQGIPGTGSNQSLSVLFTMPNSDIEVIANFTGVSRRISVIIDPPSSGTFTGPPSAVPGTSVTLTAHAGSGYDFDTWVGVPGVGSRDTLSVSFTMPTSDVTVTARFKVNPSPRSITWIINPPGTGTVSGPSSALPGTQVTLNAVPNTGYKLSSWSGIPGSGNSDLQTVSFEMPDDDVYVTANFQQIQRSITTTPNPAAGGSISAPPTAAPGDQVTIIATPNTGYTFDNWIGLPGTSGENLHTVTFTMPDSNVSITANFKTVERTISLNILPNTSSGNIDGPTSAAPGSQVTLKANPASGYGFLTWDNVPGLVATGLQSITFTMPNDNVNITARFSPLKRIKLAIDPGGSGTVGLTTPTQPGEVTMPAEMDVAQGLRITLRAIPNDNHVFDHWEGLPSNLLQGSRDTATVILNMPDTPLDIKAVFKLKENPG